MEPHISVSPYFLLVALWNLTVRYGHRPFSSMIFHTRWTRPNKISLLYQHIIPQHPQLKRSPSSPQAYHPSKIPLGGVKSWSPGVTEGRSLGLPAVGLGSAFHRLTRRGRRRTFGGHDISDIMILISSLYSYVIWYTMIIIIYIYMINYNILWESKSWCRFEIIIQCLSLDWLPRHTTSTALGSRLSSAK